MLLTPQPESSNPASTVKSRMRANGIPTACLMRYLPDPSESVPYQLFHVAARTSRQRQITSASCPRLVVAFATLAVLRATVVQTPTANPIVAALARDPVTTHLG